MNLAVSLPQSPTRPQWRRLRKAVAGNRPGVAAASEPPDPGPDNYRHGKSCHSRDNRGRGGGNKSLEHEASEHAFVRLNSMTSHLSLRSLRFLAEPCGRGPAAQTNDAPQRRSTRNEARTVMFQHLCTGVAVMCRRCNAQISRMCRVVDCEYECCPRRRIQSTRRMLSMRRAGPTRAARDRSAPPCTLPLSSSRVRESATLT